MKISSKLNIPFLKEQFLKNNMIAIENWLDDKEALKLYVYLNSLNEEEWFLSSFPNRKNKEAVENIKMLKDFVDLNDLQRLAANKACLENKFSYVFRKTIAHEKCDCVECQFKQFLNSDEVFTFLNQVTSDTYTNTVDTFASWYSDNDFLSTHDDNVEGRKIGFAYQITHNWNENWGGNLHFLNTSNYFVPDFNKMILFKISPELNSAHFVSRVINGTSYKRLTYNGWFS